MAKLIPEAERIAALQKAGLSAPVLRLAQGEAKAVHEAFVFWCETPWYGYFANRQGKVPETIPWGAPGDTLVPLWGWGETMTAYRTSENHTTDFVEISIEDRDNTVSVVAETEQGLLATLLINVIESLDWSSAETWEGEALQTTENAAQAVGFRFLSETFAFLDTVSAAKYLEEKQAFTRSLGKS